MRALVLALLLALLLALALLAVHRLLSSPPALVARDPGATADARVVDPPVLAEVCEVPADRATVTSRAAAGTSPNRTPIAAEQPRGREVPDDVLAVRVVPPEGRSAFRASVWLTRLGVAEDGLPKEWEARTGSDGRCNFLIGPSERRLRADLVALVPGHLPAILENALAWHREHPGEEVELCIRGAPLRITGHVRQADGRPAANWHVAVLDGTLADASRTLEDLVPVGLDRPIPYPLTRPDGSFVIDGLLPRKYVVFAASSRLDAHAVAEGVRAGTDVLLREREERYRASTIRVVGWNGAPVPGRRVAASLGGPNASRFGLTRDRATDARGEVSFERMPVLPLNIWVLGELFSDDLTVSELPAAPYGEELEVRIDRLVALRIHTPPGWNRTRYLRVEGERDGLHYRIRSLTRGRTPYALWGGETQFVWVPESTTHLRVQVGDLPDERAPRLEIGPLDPDAPLVELHL